MNTTSRLFLLATTALILGISGPGMAQIVPTPMAKPQTPDGLLFSLSADKGLTADVAAGQAEPIFAVGAHTVKDGAYGPALSLDDNLALAWSAPGNIYAQRGTLSFFFRPRTKLDHTPIPIFRVGDSDSTSWDMQFLRIDWNGHGFDAFVTDTGLARTRVSFDMPQIPAADQWVHLAFAWDETSGVRLWVNGRLAARKDIKAVYDSGLFGFGPFQRVVSPWQVHSMYNYRRSGDIDEIRIYDHMLTDTDVAALAQNQTPAATPVPLADQTVRDDWWLRYGWNRPDDIPAYLSDPVTRIRKVEFVDTLDLKERNFKGADGIRETTWPGVYNRSRLAGRHDYFELPDWNVYALGGKSYTLKLPDEPWNRIEINGAAYGSLVRTEGDHPGVVLMRAQGQERTSNQLAQTYQGGVIRFDNTAQETPIEEIAAYDVTAGVIPQGMVTLTYVVDASASPDLYPNLDGLRRHLDQRNVPLERVVAVALPKGAPRKVAAPGTGLPVVHVLIPGDFRDTRPGLGPSRFSYGWENMDAGLDGIAIDLPPMAVSATHKGLLPLNIRVKDPNWPDRDLMDVNVSIKPNEARTLWLDSRDRILTTNAPIEITIAAAGGGFNAASLNGTQIRLVFKKAAEARPEHIADRLEQARDNLSFLVEEQPNIRAYPLWDRFERDISDVLKVDPSNAIARAYWVEKNPEQPYAPYVAPKAPAGVPEWAFLQTQDLKLFRQFVDWWIDNRQIDDGEFGGGLSDDTDLVNQWVPLALMGVEPDKLIASQRAVLDATYADGMWSNGLGHIRADELHSYEEGINTVAQSMQINWGDPTAIERGMSVARNYPRLIQTNPAGHTHFVSAYFSGTDIDREGVLGGQRPYSFLVTHPGLLLVDYNGQPKTRATILSLLDSWLAHGTQDAKGNWRFPSDIDWQSDKATGNGVESAANVFWAAYSWTGDAKYLRPIVGDIARGNLSGLNALNADLLARAPGGLELAAKVVAGTVGASGAAIDKNTGGVGDEDFAKFVRWQKTGDKHLLVDLYGAEVETTSQRMPFLTTSHAWSDRVSVPSELLQRARMGGVAHRRNAYYPGNLVSWRFADGDTAEQVAILMPDGDPKHFRVIAYNISDKPITATMVGAMIPAGQWRVSGGVDANGDDKADAPTDTNVTLERGKGTDLVLNPHQTMVYEFTLITPGEEPSTRADIGLSRDDLTLKGNRLTIRVHSLGAKPTPAGTAVIEDAAGQPLAKVRFPGLAAPADLMPKTADVAVTLPKGAVRVRLTLDGNPPEVTDQNNTARIDAK